MGLLTRHVPDLPLSLMEVASVRRIGQIGILVPSMAPAIRTWSQALGSNDWMVFTYGRDHMSEMTYMETPGNFTMRVALIGRDPQIELIESLTGPNIYEDWAALHGFGLHHLGFYVDSIKDAVAAAQGAGIRILQSGYGYGVHGDGGFAYLDTEASLGVIFEAIEIPSVRIPSEPIPQ